METIYTQQNVMYLIWLAIFGRNGGLFGNNNDNGQLQQIQDTMNSQATNNLVMDAIKGNCASIANLAQQLGCSTNQLNSALCGLGNSINQNFAQTNYNMATQCCETKQAIKDNTLAVINKMDAIEDSRKDREISSLTASLATANARAERQAELAPLYSTVKDIQAKQPSTATINYPNLVGVPASQFYGLTTQNGYWG